MNTQKNTLFFSKLLALAGIAFCLWMNSTAANDEPLSHTPPEIYAKHLAPLLTPFEDAIARENLYEDDESGVILLNEIIHYVTEDGLRYSVKHNIYKANTEAGVDGLSEEIYSYRKSNQRI
ncbi:MAG: hypothetical protein ACPGSB_11990, partial [Opitutales bacterium]